VRIERIPLGITAGLTVRIEDSRWGALTQEFEIAAVKEETIPLRVTGAGTVVVHLHPKGAPKQALEVRGGWVVAQPAPSEGASHIALGNDLTCEMRGWTAPHLYPSLTVGARGCRERVLENVRVRDDGPTFLDVELEPR
jgi:hypothetical protein